MLKTARGCLSLLLYGSNTLFWCVPLFVVAAVKGLLPVKAWRVACSRILNAIAENWIWVNNLNQKLTGRTRLTIKGAENLERSHWYLVLANHQCWMDILVLQRVFYRKIPLLKFFLKKELVWFPLLGQAWWVLDFPFMNRYKRRHLRNKPHLKNKDLTSIKTACAKFKASPASVMNFVEGTRFTLQKQRRQNSPYTHLLRPKAGGIAFVISEMQDYIHRLLDVTIVYPEGVRSFWAFLCGDIREIKVSVQSLPLTERLVGDYLNDRMFRKDLQLWLNDLWQEKDQCIEEMLG